MNKTSTRKRRGRRLVRWLPILLILASVPWIYLGAESIPSNTADLTAWLPDDGKQRPQYEHFVELFGEDSFVLVSWPGCTLDDPRVQQLAQSLADDEDGRRLVRRVVTGPDLVAELTSEPLKLSRDEAARRLQGILVGPDRQTTGMLVLITDEGKERPSDVIQLIYRTAAQDCGIDRSQLKLGGGVYEAATIEAECDHSLQAFVLPAVMVTFAIAWLCLRRLRLVLLVVAVGAFARYMSLAFVYYTGGHVDAVMIVLPVLVMVLTISGTVHLVNYYLDGVREYGPRDAARRALRMALVPCCLAALSTAVGLLSLCIGRIAPIRQFGLYAAITLMLSLLVMLVTVPALLDVWPLRWRSRGASSSTPHRPRRVFAANLGDCVMRHHRAVMTTCLALFVVFGFGLVRTKTTVKIQRMFRADSEILSNYRWIEENIGPLTSIETLVRFDETSPLSTLQRVEIIGQLQAEIRSMNDVGGVASAATFAPEIPKPGGVRNTMRRAVLNRTLEDNRERLVREGYLVVDGDAEIWRMTARVPALLDTDYGAIVQRIEQVVAQRNLSDQPGVEISHTGVAPMIHQAQEQLLDDLVKSFILAVLLICPIMAIVLRSVVAGVLSMVPNVFPIVMVFGALGWLGIEIDLSSVLTASVALGIALDDTLHFLNWYKKSVAQGQSRREAIRIAYRRCAKAMIQTTLIVGGGVLVLVTSTYVPTSRFAVLMSILLAAALAGDLILLPALLLGPLGRALASDKRIGDGKFTCRTDVLARPSDESARSSGSNAHEITSPSDDKPTVTVQETGNAPGLSRG